MIFKNNKYYVGYIKHVNTDSKNIKFIKRNESSRLCVAKEEE